jgi:hypothetical protein
MAIANDQEQGRTFQASVTDWLHECFGPNVVKDKLGRTHRFLEEALELSQAAGCTRDEAIVLVDYVFSRPAGQLHSEVGGALVTLAGVAEAHQLDLFDAGEVELAKNYRRIDEIRKKDKRKPTDSPLPQ